MAKHKVGIIGSGSWGSRYGMSLATSEDIDLVAVAGGTRAPGYAEKFGIKCYDSIEQLLEQDEIEAVIIATHHNVHHDHAVMAAGAGKHILVEKPMAVTPEECDDMIVAAEENNIKLMVAHSRRYFPLVKMAKRIIDEGTIGEIRMMRQTFCHNARGGYEPGQEKAWWVEQGGFFLGYGCHQMDMTFHLVGCGPKTVFGQFLPYWTDVETPSSGQMFILFESGAHTTLWDLTTMPPDLEDWPPFPEMQEENYLVGDKGLMILRPYQDLMLRTDGGWETLAELSQKTADPVLDFLKEEVGDLLRAVENDEEPAVPGWQAKWTVAVIQGAFESTRTGEAVHL